MSYVLVFLVDFFILVFPPTFTQIIPPAPRSFMTFRNKLFFRWRVISPTPNPQAGRPPLVRCPRLLIQYIRTYPLYLEAVSSIRNLRTRYIVVTRDPPNMDFNCSLEITYILWTPIRMELVLILGTYGRLILACLENESVLYCISITKSEFLSFSFCFHLFPNG
jgi:hypothetical protein